MSTQKPKQQYGPLTLELMLYSQKRAENERLGLPPPEPPAQYRRQPVAQGEASNSDVPPDQQAYEEKEGEEPEPVPEDDFIELLYFGDDETDKFKKTKAASANQFYKFEYTLNLWYFLEAFLLHVAHIGILGPLIWVFFWIPCIPPCYPKLFLNMEFFSLSHAYFLVLIIWIINIMVCLCHWYWKYDAIDYSYLLIPIIVIIVRSANIAAKYATFTPKYRRRLLLKKIDKFERRSHFLLGGWSNQDMAFAEKQIAYSMRRKNIDDSTFKMSFMVPPSDFAQELLDEVKHENQTLGETTVETSFGSSKHYDCKAILFALSKYHMTEKKQDWVFMVFIFFSMVWGCSPGIARAMVGLNFCGEYALEVVIFFFGLIFYTLLMIFISVFFITAYFDYDRLIFVLEQLSQMYSPDKLSSINEKVLPTINLADAVSLQGWMNTRTVLMDYGSQYFNRHKIFVPVLLAVSATSALGLFTLASLGLTLNANGSFRIQCVLSFTFLLFGGMFLMMLRKGQLINDQHKKHIELLQENAQIFQTFHHFRDYYIGDVEDLELPYDVAGIFNGKSASYIHNRMGDELKRLLGDNYSVCNEYVEKLVEQQKEFLRQVEKDYKFYAKTLFGFNINFAVVGLFFAFYCLIIFYGYFAAWDGKIQFN